MILCTDRELSVSLAKLTLAFGGETVSAGCRLELALNIIRTALADFDMPAREQLTGHLITEMTHELSQPSEPRLPAPTAGTSAMLH
jgi:hypothetical protein